MGLWSRLLGKSAPAAAKPRIGRFDKICFGDARARLVRRDASDGRFEEAERFLQAERASSDGFAQYVSMVADWPGRPPWLDAWVERHPESDLPWLVRGMHSIRWAWQARGTGRGFTVSEEAAAVFADRLEQAVEDLERAAELRRDEPAAWSFMVQAYTGLGERESMVSAFGEATRRAPRHLLAHLLMVNGSCAKWLGSHEQMFDVARAAVRKAPSRSPLAALIARAHLERWLYFSFEGDRRGGDAYFRDTAVGAELVDAYTRFRGAAPNVVAIPLAGWLAHALYLAGRRTEAAAALRDTRGFFGELPWAWSGEPSEVFDFEARDLGVELPSGGSGQP